MVWQAAPESAMKVVGARIRKEKGVFMALVPRLELKGSNQSTLFSLARVTQVCLVQKVLVKVRQVADGRLVLSCFMKQQSSELGRMVGLAQKDQVQQRMTKELSARVGLVIGLVMLLSRVCMMMAMLSVQVVFCTGCIQMVRVTGSMEQVLTSMVEEPYSMQLLARKVKSLVEKGGNCMEMSFTREVELPAVLLMVKESLQSSRWPFCELELIGVMVKALPVGQLGTVLGYVSLQLMTSAVSVARETAKACIAAWVDCSWIEGLQRRELITRLTAEDPLATRLRVGVPILRRMVWQFSMKMTSPVEVRAVLQDSAPMKVLDFLRAKFNFKMQRSLVRRLRVLRAVRERLTPVASLACEDSAKLPKSLMGDCAVGTMRMAASTMDQHGLVAALCRQVYTCTGMANDSVVEGFTTQNPILMTEVVRTVDAKLEHTIFAGRLLVELPTNTLHDMEAMVLQNRSKMRGSQLVYPMPRSLGKSKLPSSATVGISMMSCSEVAMEVEGVSQTMRKLKVLGMETVEVKVRVLKSLPQVSIKYAPLTLFALPVLYSTSTSTLYVPMTVGKAMPPLAVERVRMQDVAAGRVSQGVMRQRVQGEEEEVVRPQPNFSLVLRLQMVQMESAAGVLNPPAVLRTESIHSITSMYPPEVMAVGSCSTICSAPTKEVLRGRASVRVAVVSRVKERFWTERGKLVVRQSMVIALRKAEVVSWLEQVAMQPVPRELVGAVGKSIFPQMTTRLLAGRGAKPVTIHEQRPWTRQPTSPQMLGMALRGSQPMRVELQVTAERQWGLMEGTRVGLLGNCTSMVPPRGTGWVVVKETNTSTFFWLTLSLFCEPTTWKLNAERVPLSSIHLAVGVRVKVMVSAQRLLRKVQARQVVCTREMEMGSLEMQAKSGMRVPLPILTATQLTVGNIMQQEQKVGRQLVVLPARGNCGSKFTMNQSPLLKLFMVCGFRMTYLLRSPTLELG